MTGSNTGTIVNPDLTTETPLLEIVDPHEISKVRLS